jgi:hypothetical protein
MSSYFNRFSGSFFLLFAAFSLVSRAASASDFHSARTAGLGGAGHAGPMLNDAIYLNPSFVSLLQTYALGINYFTFSGEGANPTDYHGIGWNLSIQDGRSELFQAGLGLTARPDSRILSIGASRKVVERLGVGIGGKFLFPTDESRTQVRDALFSVGGILSNVIQGAFIVDNIVQTDEARQRGLYREFILGTKINILGASLIYLDPHYAPDSPTGAWGWEAGMEVPIFTDFFIRAGGFRDSNIPFASVRGRGFGFGLGWFAPRISLDYSLEHALDPVSALCHNVGATIYF